MTYPELYILRHGETEWNAENRMQGALNSPLTPQGEMDAVRQGEILRSRDLTGFCFFSSPQGRAFQTAGIALARLADHIRTDDRLAEIGVGEWSGLLRKDLPMPTGPNAVMQQYAMAPGGEGFAAVKTRTKAFLDGLTGPTVIVTHGVTGAILRALVIGEKAYAEGSVHGGQGCVFHLSNGMQTILE